MRIFKPADGGGLAHVEDVVVNREAFVRLKAQGAATLYFGSLPMLEHGEFRLR